MQCIVYTCGRVSSDSDTTDEGVTLFALPKQPSLRKQWLQELCMQDWQRTWNSAVCSNHFLTEDLYMTKSGLQKLRTGALPVLEKIVEPTKTVNDKSDGSDKDIVTVKIECIETDKHADLVAVSSGRDDNINEIEIVNNANQTNDVTNLNSSHEDIIEDDHINRNVDNDVSSSWPEVPVPSSNAEDDASTNNIPSLPISDDYNIVIEVKTEMSEDNDISVKIERDGDDSDSPMLNDEKTTDDVEGDDSIDVVITSRERGEEAELGLPTAEKVTNITTDCQTMHHRQRDVNGGIETQNESEDSVVAKLSYCSKCHCKKTDPRHLECLITKHASKKLYICNLCKKEFRHKNKLIVHLRIHTGEKPYSCNVCKKSFRVKDKLKSHLRIHSGEKLYTCHICNKEFFEIGNLKYHLTTHSGKKRFSCDLCKKKFTFSSGLQRHMKTHTGDKPHACWVCDKTFNEKCNLQRHLRIHSGEKPYPCNVCKRTFSESGHLQTHLRTHSGERPYPCDICEKSFSVKSGLLRHLRIHTGNKQFSCDVCKKMFYEKGNLIKHIRLCKRKPGNKKDKKQLPYKSKIIGLKKKKM